MSIINLRTGSQSLEKTLATPAPSPLDKASSKPALPTFAEPAATPLALPVFNPVSGTNVTSEAAVPTLFIDQKIIEITQLVVLRAKEQCAVAFESGNYARPTEQLAVTLRAIAQSLAINHPEFYHHG